MASGADRLAPPQTFFRTRQHEKAIGRYTQAANYATQRAPWEAQGVMREELSTVLSNRSAAYFEAGDFISALTDADVVIQLKKPWSKGHFRKAKALIGLNRIREAREAIELGLQFEPQNPVCNFSSPTKYGLLTIRPAGDDWGSE